MDQKDKEGLAKIICYGIGIFIAYNLLVWLFKYIVAALAILGIGYIFHEYQKNDRKW